MHSKRKGNIGQTAVALAFTRLGYSVFLEFGDISKIDLIAEKDNKIIRVQVKAITAKKNILTLNFRKSGPNYQFFYKKEMVDYFAVVDLDTLKVYLVNSDVLDINKIAFSLRLKNPENYRVSNSHNAEDYLIEKILDKETL